MEERYWLNSQWDKVTVTVTDGVVTNINLLYLFSENGGAMPNITQIPKDGSPIPLIKFKPLPGLRKTIESMVWLPWDVFKEEIAHINWVYWIKL
jgi:hypothetical protein